MLLIEIWNDAGGSANGIPADYEFLPAGDAAITRAVKAAAADYPLFVRMVRPSKRYPPRAAGLWAPGEVIATERARLTTIRTDEHKARLAEGRRRRQERDITAFAEAIRRRYPGCPADEARSVAEHACEIGSGRVGRSTTADDPVRGAVVAHVRHVHTDYDDLLDELTADAFDAEDRYQAKAEARERVRDQIDGVLAQWESAGDGPPAELTGDECAHTAARPGATVTPAENGQQISA